MGPNVDHLCAQYADHAEFEPVYRIQGGDFYVFGYSAADRPQKVFGYNAAGTVVGTATAAKGGPDSVSIWVMLPEASSSENAHKEGNVFK
jgi:hypothetical protein